MENLHMHVNGGMVSVGWTKGAARYHVWLSCNPSKRVEAGGCTHHTPISPYRVKLDDPSRWPDRHKHQLFVNPLDGVERRDPGYFDTKRLNAEAKVNKPMVEEALARAEREGLFKAALLKLDDDKVAADDARLTEQADKARGALAEEEKRLLGDGNVKAATAITEYLATADRESLARLYRIVRRA